MKEKLMNCTESIKHGVKLFLGIEYRELKKEWEKQNKQLDDKQYRIAKLENRIDDLIDRKNEQAVEYKKRLLEKDQKYELEIERIRGELTEIIEGLRKDIEKKDKKLKEKEKQRRSAVCKSTSLTRENNKLKEQVEFLKTNRRAPNLKEIQDYTFRKKHKKGSEPVAA